MQMRRVSTRAGAVERPGEARRGTVGTFHLVLCSSLFDLTFCLCSFFVVAVLLSHLSLLASEWLMSPETVLELS